MPTRSRVLVVGESLVDIVRAPSGSLLTRTPGGSPLNVAVGLARLGVPTTLATDIGEDDLGALVRDHAGASGVALTAGSLGEHRTGTATAQLKADGAAAYTFALGWDPSRPALTGALAALHVGSLGTVLEPGATTVTALVDEAVRRGVPVSYDPNVRPAISPAGDAAWRAVRRLAGKCRVVKVSEEDLDHLQPGRDIAAVLEELLTPSATWLAVCTLGPAGAVALTSAATARVPAPTVEVVDTVGAGDSFMAALLAALLDAGWLGAGGCTVGEAELSSLLRSATEPAAITCSRRGADPPRRAELSPRWPYRRG